MDILNVLIANLFISNCAKSITFSDKKDFDFLYIKDFKVYSLHFKRIDKKWNNIAGVFAKYYKAYL